MKPIKKITLTSSSTLKFPSKIFKSICHIHLFVWNNFQQISAGIQQTFIEYQVQVKNLKKLGLDWIFAASETYPWQEWNSFGMHLKPLVNDKENFHG